MNEEKIICNICGLENEPGSIFCGECGAKLTKPAETTEAEETTETAESEATEETTETAESELMEETTETAESEATVETTEIIEPDKAAESEPPTENDPQQESETPTESEPPKAEKPAFKLSKKTLLIGGGVFAFLVIAAVITVAVNVAGGGIYIKAENSPSYVYSSESTQGAVLGYSDETWIIEKSKSGFTDIQTSTDGSASLVIAEDGDDAVIYYISDKVQEIIDVPDYAKCEISGNGNAFVFLSGNKQNEYTLTLYRDGKTEVLTEEADNGVALNISPNGSAVTWGEEFDYDDYSFKTMLYVNGAVENLGKSLDVYGISDNVKNIYFQKGEGIYAQKSFEEDSRIKIASSEYSPYFTFNDDLSQAVVAVSDDSRIRSYFYESGKEAVKLGNEYYSLMTPLYYSGTTDLKKALYFTYESDYDIYGLDKDLKPYKIVSGVDEYMLSPDGTELLYIKRDKLYSIATSDKDNKEKELYADVVNFSVSDDFKNIYFKNEDGELYYLKSAGKAEAVSYDFDYDYYFVKGDSVYYLEGTEVFCGTKGKGKLVGEIDFDSKDAEYVRIRVTQNNIIIVQVSDENWNETVFISDGRNFTEVDDL
jgi:hypothetical protein